MESRRIPVTYRRDGSEWMVWMTDDERAHTCGRTLAEARKNILEVIELWLSVEEDRELDDSRQYELVETFDLDQADEIAVVREDRAAQAAVAERLATQTPSLARRLTAQGISRRDIADMLGISHQRVQQLVKG